jgi:hypothetical protein
MHELPELAECHANGVTDLASLISELWRHGQRPAYRSAPLNAASATAEDYLETLVEETVLPT